LVLLLSAGRMLRLGLVIHLAGESSRAVPRAGSSLDVPCAGLLWFSRGCVCRDQALPAGQSTLGADYAPRAETGVVLQGATSERNRADFGGLLGVGRIVDRNRGVRDQDPPGARPM